MSLLPNKTIRLKYSQLGVGAEILQYMTGPETVTSLWNKVRDLENVNTYEKFIAALVLLYSLKAINMNEGILQKNEN